jgi:hypothetical protein
VTCAKEFDREAFTYKPRTDLVAMHTRLWIRRIPDESDLSTRHGKEN